MNKSDLKKLVDWSEEFRTLPWRSNRSIYNTLISEIMLQQTTVPTVLGHFSRFLQQFPDLNSLAAATEDQLLIAWKGLGYYRRARNLLALAKEICRDEGGIIPLDLNRLKEISGIGDYTACAILAIGANQNLLCIDANLERVLSRFYLVEQVKGLPLKNELKRGFEAKEYLPHLSHWGGRAVNEALMDLGREICVAKNPRCQQCPIAKNCQAYANNQMSNYPKMTAAQKQKKAAKPLKLKLLRVVVREKDQLWAHEKQKGQWLEGHFELPTFIIESQDPQLEQYPLLPQSFDRSILKKLPTYSTVITKYKIENVILEASKKQWSLFKKQGDYFLLASPQLQKLSTASLKALKLIGLQGAK